MKNIGTLAVLTMWYAGIGLLVGSIWVPDHLQSQKAAAEGGLFLLISGIALVIRWVTKEN